MLDLEGDRGVPVAMEWTLRGCAGGEDIFSNGEDEYALVGLATRPICLFVPVKGPAMVVVPPALDELPAILAFEGPGTLSSFGRFVFESDCSAFSFPSLASLDLNSARYLTYSR